MCPGGTLEHRTVRSKEYFWIIPGLKVERANKEHTCCWDDAGAQQKMPESGKEDTGLVDTRSHEEEDVGLVKRKTRDPNNGPGRHNRSWEQTKDTQRPSTLATSRRDVASQGMVLL
ncbi:hypothetical protein NDU88_000502 [Pleurodeles waltl]|uniref:Uncharacterized protein n=1 Tax=Pleurodeles waltl TaxID=8319 RepID=A0AAV7Q353_PLEWA|nr:hypothetical protein NDU88_000502 [Pleurodeles waltl]